MLVNLDETKQYLRIDGDEEDSLLTSLIQAAETYLKNATGKEFDETNHLAKLFCLVLIADWYENREYAGKTTNSIRPIVASILAQLNHCCDPPEVDEA